MRQASGSVGGGRDLEKQKFPMVAVAVGT
jgi:hypothetical protein